MKRRNSNSFQTFQFSSLKACRKSAGIRKRSKRSTRKVTAPKLRAEITASTDYITLYKKEKPVKTILLNSLAVYVKPLRHFFIPRNLGEQLVGEFAE